MTHPDGTPYTLAERMEILATARRLGDELIRNLEKLAEMEERQSAEVAERAGNRGDASRDRP